MTTVPEHQPESAPLTITVDGEQRTVGTGTSAADLYREDRSVVVARVNGVLKDLATGLADGDAVERVLISEPEGLEVLRHSAAHVMAQAVQQLHEDAKLGIGP